MPPRLSKRHQREIEELEELSLSKSQLGQKEKVDAPRPPAQGIGFSALVISSDEQPEEDDVIDVKVGKKKKKKKTGQASISRHETPTRSEPSPVLVRNEKKAAKKARAKKTKEESDDFDQILTELSLQYSSSQKISQSSRPSLTDLLGVSLQFLDAEAEMRRFFGSKVVLASKASESSRKVSKKPQNIRSHLARPQASWWPGQGREGLSLRAYSKAEVSEKFERHHMAGVSINEKWWTVEYSRKYKTMTRQFMSAVMAGDPQVLFDQLGLFPWHADTLLQIAEVYRHREEHAQAIDFIDRSLFTYERCLMGVFNFTTGLNRLDFDRVENRPFFLALHRQVADLQRRGCVRSSFEFARLLYGLDPWNDPHGAVFHLEYLAIKANMHQWLLDLYDVFLDELCTSKNAGGRLNPSVLPGWAYSRALALKIIEDTTDKKNHTKSEIALRQAGHDFPSVIPLLADKLDVSLPSNIRSHKDFKIETDSLSLSPVVATLHILSHLYVQRCFPLWKEHATWFSKTISEEFSTLPASSSNSDKRNAFYDQYEHSSLRYSVYRHILVLDAPFRRLVSFIPREVIEGKSLACDPLPPSTAQSHYDQEFFRGTEDIRSERRHNVVNQQLFDQLLGQHLQEFFDANPQLLQRFPGGVNEFAQMVAGLPPDIVGDVMLAELHGQGGMPGGLDAIDVGHDDMDNVEPDAGAEEEEEEEDEEENENEEDESEDEDSSMRRVLRNIIGRVFGRRSAESSSDEDAPLDDMGVD